MIGQARHHTGPAKVSRPIVAAIAVGLLSATSTAQALASPWTDAAGTAPQARSERLAVPDADAAPAADRGTAAARGQSAAPESPRKDACRPPAGFTPAPCSADKPAA